MPDPADSRLSETAAQDSEHSVSGVHEADHCLTEPASALSGVAIPENSDENMPNSELHCGPASTSPCATAVSETCPASPSQSSESCATPEQVAAGAASSRSCVTDSCSPTPKHGIPGIAADGIPVIAIDAMGGDHGPSVTVPGALGAARAMPMKLLLVGREDDLTAELARHDTRGLDIQIVHAGDVAGMHEKPSDILRRKKDASIQVACRLVRDGQAHGVVSAGHSGASVACGMFILGRMPGVERPALASLLPTEKEPIILLDVGANVDCKPYHLFQFGLMGEAFARDLLNNDNPRVGILSIGEEEGKGNTLVKEAYDLLKMVQSLNFVGNVEGRDLFTGNVDVAVCDGFVGNVALKLSEGLGSSLTRLLKRQLLTSGLMAKVGTFLARSAFRRFARIVDYAEYGGALLLGLQGIFVVCHGASNAKAMRNATKMAGLFVQKQTNKRLVDTICANEELTRFGRSC